MKPETPKWSYSALRREYGEEAALLLLATMRGRGEYSEWVSSVPSDYRHWLPYRDVEMHPEPDGLPPWVMPWETWSLDGVWNAEPTLPDGVWITHRQPMADDPRRNMR